MQVKIFQENIWCVETLEEEINEWLKSVDDIVQIVNIKMATADDRVIISLFYKATLDTYAEYEKLTITPF